MTNLIVITGPIAVGKMTVAEALKEKICKAKCFTHIDQCGFVCGKNVENTILCTLFMWKTVWKMLKM